MGSIDVDHSLIGPYAMLFCGESPDRILNMLRNTSSLISRVRQLLKVQKYLYANEYLQYLIYARDHSHDNGRCSMYRVTNDVQCAV